MAETPRFNSGGARVGAPTLPLPNPPAMVRGEQSSPAPHANLRLPTGMRDHAPEAASARRRIVDGLLTVFERHGFLRVITPAFEYEDVLALGMGDAARAATFRFVEPSSGQVV